jgi:hypothetical protein
MFRNGTHWIDSNPFKLYLNGDLTRACRYFDIEFESLGKQLKFLCQFFVGVWKNEGVTGEEFRWFEV